MKNSLFLLIVISISLNAYPQPSETAKAPVVKTANGMLEGTYESGINIFKAVPFAAPPVGQLRWAAPQPVIGWTGTRKATVFAPKAMQLPLFSDMMFRSNGTSEDCLYLNIWTPAKTFTERLPVMVYFYGGGLMAGDGSEYRYDGENMARHGIIAITVNYRLSVFGFMAHPELSKESPHHASGNYGFLDQAAALQWVANNIAAFGGDPKKITIAGESAGSFSVCAQMLSPLSKNLIAGAIGESGSVLGGMVHPLSEAEQTGVRFMESLQAKNIAELRAMPAEKILEATKSSGFGRFPIAVDGYFFPKMPEAIFASGEQAKVPLLFGWNTREGSSQGILGRSETTIAHFNEAVQKMYGENAADILKVYHPATDADVLEVAANLASDRFIGFGTWKWGDMHAKSSGQAVYRYLYAKPRPAKAGDSSAQPYVADGAVHSAEIEYAMGNLPTNRVFDWQPEDYTVSEVMQGFFLNFIKTGNPNGLGLPQWPAIQAVEKASYMHIDTSSYATPEIHRDRYLVLDKLMKN